ncbi:Dabb family protein [Frigoribacterium sp. PvP032]|uniref:Dabb family protein n=1 Tax=Frigoribacterium sp. PvP032 TaxID=2806589 RepID=UPI001AE588A7|nr:Dabb family protein [Frigoribacterium sp. PvP032]MBP1189217.1 hypothetical protein [Frigoribacterium sp. PvP032]
MAETAELLHVVLAEWNDGVDATEQASTLSDEHLTTIDGVLSVSSGPTVSGEGLEGGFHWMLVVRFRDRAALDAYLPHPEHLPVAGFLRDSAARVVVFDIAA